MKPFSKEEVTHFLSVNLKEWTLDSDFIRRDFKFKSFVEAFSFMTAVALEAEKADHHPDWSNVYNTVIIKLRTHSANGITKHDIDLARSIDQLNK